MPQSRAVRAGGGSMSSFQIAPVLMLHTSDSCRVMVTGSVCPPKSSSTSELAHQRGMYVGPKWVQRLLAPKHTRTVVEDHQHMCGSGLHNACTG